MRSLAGLVAVALLAAAAGGASPEARVGTAAPEVRAREWLNPQPVLVLASVKSYVLVFYDIRASQPGEEGNEAPARALQRLVRQLDRINDHYRKQGLQVIGLSHQGSSPVRAFIERLGVHHKMGVVSLAAREYGVDELPYLVFVHEGVIRYRGSDVRGLVEEIEKALGESDGSGESAGWAWLDGAGSGELASTFTDDQRRERVALMVDAADRADAELNWLVDQLLSPLAPAELLEPADLAPFDAYYDAGLSAARAGDPAAGSPTARATLITTAYRRLLDSGRLSPAARAHLRDRLFDICTQDEDLELESAIYLKYFVDAADVESAQRLAALYAAESDPFLRQELAIAYEWCDPATTADARRFHWGQARYYRTQLGACEEPAASRWAEAYDYQVGASQRSEAQTVGDYWAHLRDTDDEQQRENDLIVRWEAAVQLMRHVQLTEDPQRLRQAVLNMLGQEPDHGIRYWLMNSLVGEPAEVDERARAQLTPVFRRMLQTEPAASCARAYLEHALQEWGEALPPPSLLARTGE